MSNIHSRRHVLRQASLAAGGLLAPPVEAAPAQKPSPQPLETRELDLCGEWHFQVDPSATGERERWFDPSHSAAACSPVTVPHTFQIVADLAEYRGISWYRREFSLPESWLRTVIRLEFEAVFHTARVWVNGTPAGEHLRKGYTAFTLDVTKLAHAGKPNLLVVQVDNSFNEHMLPRGRSSDWAHDGGIYRPVKLLSTGSVFIERLDVDASIDWSTRDARIQAKAYVRNAGAAAAKVDVSATIADASGNPVEHLQAGRATVIEPGQQALIPLSTTLTQPQLWHFDHPHLYTLMAETTGAETGHRQRATFGIRQLAVKGTTFLFNNEPVRLMGVERMAGSNPEYGMAEPSTWIEHDHRDLKELNCVFTRVHWPQDRRVLDYCDRNGILMQSEVPTWGPKTFKDMGAEPDADIMENGLQQLREMVARDRNHPCIVSWGLCNEIGGQNPPAYNFAKHMLEEAKRLDPARLCSYASNSLFHTQSKDVSGLMDFVECNEYYGSWHKGGPEDLSRTLDEIHTAFPDKPVVISEYGYCACTADRPEGDGHRRRVLNTQDVVLRNKPFVAGAIFFCYNDYRTHIGDTGTGVMKQRVHGVVDLYGDRKPSFKDLRIESSPIEKLTVTDKVNVIDVELSTRSTLPCYALRGYTLRAVYYGSAGIPVERKDVTLPDLKIGEGHKLSFKLSEPPQLRVKFDVLRPDGFSITTAEWRR